MIDPRFNRGWVMLARLTAMVALAGLAACAPPAEPNPITRGAPLDSREGQERLAGSAEPESVVVLPLEIEEQALEGSEGPLVNPIADYVFSESVESLEDLVAHGAPPGPFDAIVVGVVDAYLDFGYEPIEPDMLNTIATLEAENAGQHVIDDIHELYGYTEVRIRVEDVLLDDGRIGRDGEFTLVLRPAMKATPDPHADTSTWLYPPELPGQRFLYFLERDGDVPGRYSSAEVARTRIVVDGTVAYSDGPRSPLPFATGTPGPAFVEAVRAEVARRYGQGGGDVPTASADRR